MVLFSVSVNVRESHMATCSEETRSRIMRTVKGTNTKPEMLVRQLTHRMGYRYRLHCKKLPGKPDMVFPARRKIIFVHGCFWHQHQCSRGSRIPKSNQDYWIPKLSRNVQRDREHKTCLKEMGWDVLTIWECETKDRNAIQSRIRSFLG